MRDRHFVGSKGGSGIAQWIISNMPLHSDYYEAFLGKGVVIKKKLPAKTNVGIEADSAVIADYWHRPPQTMQVIHGDAIAEVPKLAYSKDALVYADPPYLMETRSCKRDYYGREFSTVEDHTRLLTMLKALPCMCMISGYQSELYSMQLTAWRTSWKWTTNRRGKLVKEWLWMNFPEPAFFHDTRFCGSDFTDRQRIKRKVERWKNKFMAMPAHERGAILDCLCGPQSQKHLSDPVDESGYGIPSPLPLPCL